MAGVEVEKIVQNTEEMTTATKPTSETPKETLHSDDSATEVEVEIKEDEEEEEEEAPKVEKEIEKTGTTDPVKEEKPVEIQVAMEEKDVKPVAEKEKAVQDKTV